ncbi:MAG TPA: TlpA disulfide reductase family protein [Armatimonadota bacterium]|jgi:peroxiredoxin
MNQTHRLLTILLLGGLLTLAGCPGRSGPAPTTPAATPPGETVKPTTTLSPDLTFTALDGKTLKLSELKGKVVVVDFWGMLCSGCVEELGKYEADPSLSKNPKVQIIAVDNQDTAPEAVRKFVQEHGWTYPVVMATEELRQAFGLVGKVVLPQVRIIGPEGTSFTALGPAEANAEQVKKRVGALLSAANPMPTPTPAPSKP